MDKLTPYLLAIITTVIASLIFYLMRVYILERETPLPFIRQKNKSAYQHLNKTWFQYHVTRNNHRSSNPFWVRDVMKLRVKRGTYVRGELLFPAPGEIYAYKTVGEIRQGRLIITGRSERNPEDFFTAIFPDLTVQDEKDTIVGTMLAFDFQNSLYVGPMILSQLGNLSVNKLNEIVATLAFPEKHVYNFFTREEDITQLGRKVFKAEVPKEKSLTNWISNIINYLKTKWFKNEKDASLHQRRAKPSA